MYLGALGISYLGKIQFFAEQLILAKVLIMGSKFVLNYFTKRWVFEK